MTALEPAHQSGGLDEPHRLLAALEAATTPVEVRFISDRAEALFEAAKRARVADEQLRQLAAVALRAQRRGGELLQQTPRARTGMHVGTLPTLAELLGVRHDVARHIADNWRAVASVPDHLFDEYVARSDRMPTRGGLLRYHQPRPRHPAGRGPSMRNHPAATGHLQPPPDRLRIVPEPVEDTTNRDLKAEAWQECVEWFARQIGSWRVVDACLQAGEAANPYAATPATEAGGDR